MQDHAYTLALETYSIRKRIDEHFKDHHFLTKEDFKALLEDEEYLKEARRSLLELEGDADLVIFDSVDMP